MLKRIAVALGLPVFIALTGCLDEGVDRTERIQQEASLKQANAQIGLPNIVNFSEKKLTKMLMELRDEQKLPTYSYISNQSGLFFLCNSIGYGIPYATQLTNPEKPITSSSGTVYYDNTVPQAEPNGLFMPASAEATWTICNDEKGGIVPVYVEAHLVVSPFKLNPTGNWGTQPTIKSQKKLEIK
jgi:hypothetical protein